MESISYFHSRCSAFYRRNTAIVALKHGTWHMHGAGAAVLLAVLL